MFFFFLYLSFSVLVMQVERQTNIFSINVDFICVIECGCLRTLGWSFSSHRYADLSKLFISTFYILCTLNILSIYLFITSIIKYQTVK